MKIKNTKRCVLAPLALCGLLALGGCATSNAGSTTSATDENSAVEEATLATRTVTFPALYFQNQTEEEAKAALEGNGATDIVVNEDGSYTMTMGIDKYNELVDGLYTATQKALDEIPNSESFPSITSIEYDETFSVVTMTSAARELGLSEMFVGLTGGLAANMYQQIAGQPVNCTVTVLDPDGNEIQSNVYPDDFESAATPEAH